MLYPTHHPFFVPFTFTAPILSPSPTTLPFPIPVEQSMDYVEATLKPSFEPPKKAQSQPQGFSVDSPAEQKQSNKTSFDFGCSELSVPAEDAASLEWLSHFVEDSFSNYSVPFPAGKSQENPVEHQSEPVKAKPCFVTSVQTKARSKRSRTGFRVWSLSSTSESSTSSSSTTSSSPDSLLRPPIPSTEAKKQKRRKRETGGGGAQQPRRCSHCLVQKTPQWRAGPLGAKTLCNACGVRFKSGRLLPEYRPACSPTFSSDVHSNNHRKVMEMRRKKEPEHGAVNPTVHCDLFALRNVRRATLSSLSLAAIVAMDVSHFICIFSPVLPGQTFPSPSGMMEAGIVVPTLKAFSLRTHDNHEFILAAGDQEAAVLSPGGSLLSSIMLPSPPTHALICEDFSNDGLTDLILVTSNGVYGFVQTRHPGALFFSMLISCFPYKIEGAGYAQPFCFGLDTRASGCLDRSFGSCF
ncbi:GATA transcription factor 5 [Actinidia rufa]|uniref:GATA transcription factor 5 n=1 Tax=Actinidia rufa TaxID=165716 RepID=A0A7J0E309_9ERIC|nr:GATA transcription factor 5 [Actinidia rufa]